MKFFSLATIFVSTLSAAASPLNPQDGSALSKRSQDPFYLLASGGGVANGKYAVWTSADLSPVNFTATKLSQASTFYITDDGFNNLVASDGRPPATILNDPAKVQLRRSGSQTDSTNLISCKYVSGGGSQLNCDGTSQKSQICSNAATWWYGRQNGAGCASVTFYAIAA